MQQHSSLCYFCSVILVMSQSWHAHLKACSTSMLGNTVRFRGRTTPVKIPSIMKFCKTPFNSGDELNNLSSDTPWKLVSFRNIFMPVIRESMTEELMSQQLTVFNGHNKALQKLSHLYLLLFSCQITLVYLLLTSLLSHLYSVPITRKKFSYFTALSVWCLSQEQTLSFSTNLINWTNCMPGTICMVTIL